MTNLVIIGELFDVSLAAKIIKLAEQTGSYIVADISSNLRLLKHPLILTCFDLALLNQDFRSLINFKTIIYFGDRLVSKRLLSWLSENTADKYYRYDNNFNYIDSVGIFEQISSFDEVSHNLGLGSQPCSKIAIMHETIKNRVRNFLEHDHKNEAYYAASLIKFISEPVNLFVSSSMPIRDLDQFAQPTETNINIFVNRGASGIDGIISTAVGVSIGIRLPTILLIGDIAFLHDTNGIMLIKQSPMPMLIIVINNHGGGIFHFLPIVSDTNVISPYLDTPHTVEIKYLCAAHSILHCAINNGDAYQAAIGDFFRAKKTRVLEVNIDREHNVALHKAFYQALKY